MYPHKRFFAILLGLVFFYSGLVKLLDPVGTGLILKEYFSWMHLGFMAPAAKITGVVMSLFESIMGAALISGVWRRTVALLSSLLLLFFTVISAALVLDNPSMDCGCFGEHIHLTHSQTLVKNLLLCVVAFFAFVPVWKMGIAPVRKFVPFCICCAAILSLGAYSWITIPYFDFMEFSPSTTLISEDSKENSDVTAVLPLWTESGEDVSAEVLEGDVALISVYDPDRLSQKDLSRIGRFAALSDNQGFRPYVISTRMLDVPGVECFYCDYKTLMTLNRSNWGVTLLGDGFVIDKCSHNDLYTAADLSDILDNGAEGYYVKKSTSKAIAYQGAAFFVLLLLIL